MLYIVQQQHMELLISIYSTFSLYSTYIARDKCSIEIKYIYLTSEIKEISLLNNNKC